MDKQTVECWRQIILSFESAAETENPFLDIEIWAKFTGPDGNVIRREAYWDGGRTYRVSFAPTQTGVWRYELSAPAATGLDRVSGEVECVPYTGDLDIYRHGFLKVSNDRRYLTYADGTPFFWLGDIHWYFSRGERWDESNYPGMDSMFRGIADRRAAQGYTVYRTNLRSDNCPDRSPHYWEAGREDDLPNVDFYRNELDRRMNYIADLGIVNAVDQDWYFAFGKTPDVGHQKNMARYIIARYGALPVIWTLATEPAGYEPDIRQLRIDSWNEVACYIHERDGYGTLQSVQYTNERPFPDYYYNKPWHSFTLNQGGHGDHIISVSDYRDYIRSHGDKPFVEGEALYESVSTLEEMGTRMCTDAMVRRVAYLAMQMGACGYTYGVTGIVDCRWDKAQTEPPLSAFNRFNVAWSEGIDRPGGVQMSFLRKFYERVRFHELQPFDIDDPSVGRDAPAATHTSDGSRWVLYYPENASRSLTLTNMANGEYKLTWFDPRKGEYSESEMKIRPDNGRWETPAKPEAGDWLLIAEI